MKKRLLSSLFAFGLLSLLLVQQIALLPFAQTASAQSTTLSTTKVETYEQKARKYALTRAVGQCLSELDDSTSIHDSWDDNFGQTDAGDNINVGLLVAPGSGVMECGEVMPTALNEFGYGDTPGGRQEFFTDLGAKCDSSGNNCGDYKDFADLENNMANVAKKKGIPTQQTDDIRLPELWKTAQQACSLSPQPVYESVDSPEAKAANITNAISSNTGRYIVYYSIGADSSGLPILTSPVYQFEDGSDAGLWHYTGGYGDDGDNLGDNSLLSIPASEAIVGADFAALNLADADTGCNYLAEYINKKSAAAAGEQLKAVKKESDAAASAAFVSTVIDQIAPLAGCQKPSGDITSPAGIRQKEEYDNCVDNKGIRAAVTNCLSPLSATKLDDAQKKTIASCISAKLKLDLGAVTTAVNNGANAATAAAAGVVQASLTNTSTQGTASDNSCGINAQGFGDRALSWFACPLSAGLADFARFLGSEVADFLYINPQQTFSEGAEKAAKTFRNLGLALVIIAGLAMVISQAIGLEIFDAYTIRKLMPRLLIALVGIAVSWPLLRFVVDLFNDLGVGVRSLILGPFSEFGTNYSELGTLAGGAASIGSTLLEWLIAIVATGGIGIALGWAGIGLMLLSIILALLIAFVVLGVRQAVVLMAVVMAPLAIAAYVLPGTQKVWSFWKNTIITALVMFPIVTGLLAATEALSRVMMKNDDQFLAIVVFFAGYAAIPTAFKMAGGLIATIANFGQQRTGGLFGALKKGRQNRMGENWQKTLQGTRWTGARGGRWAHRAQTGALIATGKTGLGSLEKMRSNLHASRSNMNTTLSQKARENSDVQALLSDDHLMNGYMHGEQTYDSAMRYFMDHGDNEVTARRRASVVEKARKAVGRGVLDELVPVANAGTKTGFAGGRAELNDWINKVAGDDDIKRGRMMGAAREAAKAAQRVDLYGGSYGDAVDLAAVQREDISSAERARIIHRHQDSGGVMADLDIGQRMTPDIVNQIAGRSVLRNNSMYEIGGAYYLGLEHMTGPILQEINEAQTAYESALAAAGENPSPEQQATIERTRHEHIRLLAKSETLLQIAGQVSGRNQQTLGAIMGQEVLSPSIRYEERVVERPMLDASGNQMVAEGVPLTENVTIRQPTAQRVTLRQAIYDAESSEVYNQYVKTYMRQAQQEAALAEATARAGGLAPPTGFTPTTPG